jgi:ABC transporter with metal-binding/Fe-S-binding domain ATP-binding protein
MPRGAGVLFTGGKDSVYALHKALSEGYEVKVLLTVIPHYEHSMLYHKPPYQVLLAQAKSLGIPLESVGLSSQEGELSALEHLLKRARDKYGVELVVTGALKSNFQRRKFAEAASKLGMELYSPHWGLSDEEYMESLLRHGIKFIIVSITSMGIPLGLLGKALAPEDLEVLKKLSKKYGFNLSFEGGEAETLVVDAPLFKYRLEVEGRPVVVSEYEGYFVVSKCKLVKKS